MASRAMEIEGEWDEACCSRGMECDRGEAKGDWAISVLLAVLVWFSVWCVVGYLLSSGNLKR